MCVCVCVCVKPYLKGNQINDILDKCCCSCGKTNCALTGSKILGLSSSAVVKSRVLENSLTYKPDYHPCLLKFVLVFFSHQLWFFLRLQKCLFTGQRLFFGDEATLQTFSAGHLVAPQNERVFIIPSALNTTSVECPACQQYQVGKKCVQMLRVSLVSWKRLRMQSLAELQGCRYPEMMLSSWKTCKTGPWFGCG